jgi:CO dehydrogenase maturation factor
MSDVIVVAGKGGTGKTTMSSLIVLMLAQRGFGSVLAVDADPNSNLAESLGVKNVVTIADVVDKVALNPEVVPVGMGKESYIEFQIQSEISEEGGFDLLVMGRPEGPGCYCYINNVLRNCMAKLIKSYDHIVIDNEAGLEHFSRKTTRICDKLIVVSDETVVGMKSAQRILDLIQELGIVAKKKFLILNRKTKRCVASLKSSFKVDKVFCVSFDKAVALLSSKGESLKSLKKGSGIWADVKALGDEIWLKN